MNRFISLSVLLALIVVLGSTMYQVITPFLLPLFLAAVLAIICQPMFNFFLQKAGNRTAVSAALTTLSLLAILVVPMVVGTLVCAIQLYSLGHQHLDGDWHRGLDIIWNRGILPAIDWARTVYPGGLTDEQLDSMKQQFADSLQGLAGQIAGRTFQIASSTVGIFVSLTVAAGMFITALYYFLADGPAIIAAAEEMIPLPVDYQRRLCRKFEVVVRAVVMATFVAAFVQGFATALALHFCGFGYFWVFLAIATFASLIPLVGAWIVWVPCAVLLGLQGHWTAAIMLGLWGLIVVSMLDNIVKIYMLQNDADLHPLLAFISVIGALEVLGLWGIFIGPIVASCLFALIQIFNAELKELSKERQTNPIASPPQPMTTLPTLASVPTSVAAKAPNSTPESNPSAQKQS